MTENPNFDTPSEYGEERFKPIGLNDELSLQEQWTSWVEQAPIGSFVSFGGTGDWSEVVETADGGKGLKHVGSIGDA